MGIKSERRDIEGTTYEVTQFGARKGQTILLRLFKVLGPAASELAAMKENGVETTLARAVEKLSSTADEKTVMELCDEFAKSTRVVDGNRSPLLSDIYEVHFAGQYWAWLQWLKFAIEVNYGATFLGRLVGQPAAVPDLSK